MPIPIPKVKIELTPTTCSQLTPQNMHIQLLDMGVPCATDPSPGWMDELNNLIKESVDAVGEEMKERGVTGLKCYNYHTITDTVSLKSGKFRGKMADTLSVETNTGDHDLIYLLKEEDVSVNYKPSTALGGYTTTVYTILHEPNFEHLMAKSGQDGYIFQGQVAKPVTTTKNVETKDGITKVFVQTTASACMIYPASDGGVDKNAMEAAMNNTIGKSLESGDNYSDDGNKNFMLVDRYDEDTSECEGFGGLNIFWSLKIKDYKRKNKDGGDYHKVTITTKARGVFYGDTKTMCTDLAAITDAEYNSTCWL